MLVQITLNATKMFCVNSLRSSLRIAQCQAVKHSRNQQNARLSLSSVQQKALTFENMNPRIKNIEYAVRGKVPIEAMKIQQQLKKGSTMYNFDSILFANIGDCHAMGQKPLTFARQLLSACVNPSLIHTNDSLPSDVRERAKVILDDCSGGSVGSYTDSRGIPVIRNNVANFIGQRDHIPATLDDIYLINGATEGIKAILQLCLLDDEEAGVLIPIPQYPLYTASIAELGAYPIKYYLEENNNWAITIEQLRKSISASKEHCKPRMMVVINPGNPTGQHLSEENMKEIITFCQQEELVLIADEVYQENVWAEEAEFKSFRKVLLEMGQDYQDVQLVSFNSTSKGFFGECGIRGGYMEMTGFDEQVMEQIYKLFSTKLCANSAGQVITDVLVKQPQPGDPSFDLFEEEKQSILQSLNRRATMVYEKLNSIDGVSCNKVDGAMYAFPRVEIPESAIEAASKEDPNIQLDEYYCLELLRQHGVCVVPGSGFGQLPNTWHFRTTILPSESDLKNMLEKFEIFHKDFIKKHGK